MEHSEIIESNLQEKKLRNSEIKVTNFTRNKLEYSLKLWSQICDKLRKCEIKMNL